jgi:hypothetical protein
MPCPGLHCPGCSSGQSAGVLAAVVGAVWVADQLCQWVAEHIWEIGGTVAACFLLAVAASMALGSWADHRGARFAQRHGIRSRADVIQVEPVRAVVVDRGPEHPAIAPAIIVNFYGADSGDLAARVIRTALPGYAGDAITEGE